MESSRSIYCYLYFGGEIENGFNGSIDYKGGWTSGIIVDHGTSHDEFVLKACKKVQIDPSGLSFKYTLKFDPSVLLPLDDDDAVNSMVLFSDGFSRVYIVQACTEVEQGVADGQSALANVENHPVLRACREETEQGVADGQSTPVNVDNHSVFRACREEAAQGVVDGKSTLENVDDHSVFRGCREEAAQGVIDGKSTLVNVENHSASTPSSSQGMNDDYTIQKHGFASRCTEFEAYPLASSTPGNPILGSGQSFANADEFRNALYLMSLAGRFRYKFKRNCPRYVSVCCAVNGCTWKIAACGVKGTKMVRVYSFQNDHNHSTHEDTSPLPTVRSCKLAILANDVIKATPDCMPRQICKDFERQHGIRMTYNQAWQIREKVKERIFGLSDNSYKLLPWLCEQLTKSNPGTIAEWTSSDEGNFLQLFIAYGVCVRGFLTGCRPIISIDSSELSGLHKGTLLSASAYDADDNMFLIAYAIVSSKNYDDWLWFLQKLKQLVGKMEVVIISDMHLDIVRSVGEVFGVENHIYCYQHLKESFSRQLTKKNTKGRKGKEDALMFLDTIAYTRLQIDYIPAMENLRRYSTNLAKWVEDSGPEHWALSKFSKKRWDKMNTNLAGLFDDLVNEDQHHSIFNFVVKHMEKLASLLTEHKAATHSWKRFISPKVEDKVLLNIAKAEAFTVIPYTDTFKVKTRDRSHCVDLKQHTCTCSAWQMLGIPCEHACAVIQMMNQDVYGFVEAWFHLPKQEMIYSGILHPLDFHNMPTVDSDGNVQDQNGVTYASLDPPTMKRRIGRPPQQRNKFQFREKRTVFCSHCNGAGHNCTTCKNPTSRLDYL